MSLEDETIPERISFFFKKGTFAVIDQGVFSGANFIINIMLARWLEPSQYGAFATAYSVFLLLAAFHTAVLTEPMMVFGAGRYANSFRKYIGILFWGHTLIILILIAIPVFLAVVYYRSESTFLAMGFLGVSIAAPFILLLWLFRRSLYARFQPSRAAIGGTIYLVITLGLLFGVHQIHGDSVFTAFLVMGLGALVANAWFIGLLKPQFRLSGDQLNCTTVFNSHLQYGKWALLTRILRWPQGNAYYIFLPLFVGLGASGALRALMNITSPVTQFMSAVGLILLSKISQLLNRKEMEKVLYVIILFLSSFLAITFIYWILITGFSIEIINFIYEGKYNEYASSLTWIAILPMISSFTIVLGSFLQGAERPKLIFFSYIGSVIALFAAGIPLIIFQGVEGAINGFLISQFLYGTLIFFFSIRIWRSFGMKR